MFWPLSIAILKEYLLKDMYCKVIPVQAWVSEITIRNRTCDRPACSAVSQSTAPPRAPLKHIRSVIIQLVNSNR